MGYEFGDKAVAVVTGAARGIGRAILVELAACGVAVYGWDLPERLPGAEDPGGRAADWLAVDVSDRRAVLAAAGEVERARGRVDILVNNAGVSQQQLAEEISPDDLERILAVNLKGAFHCCQALLPGMKERRHGKIVSMSSRAALGKATRAAYSATKAGLVGLTRTMALEVAPFGVNVNAVAPGPIRTELFDAVNPPESEATRALVRSIPLGRIGTPRDVARLTCFLASEDASFITGQTIYICGGMTVGVAPV
jgi:NAD(P)-dependent dehydrogenase (short-subunit alcohol dehydrogenase family)